MSTATEVKIEEGKGFLNSTMVKEERQSSPPCWKTRRFIYCVSCVVGSILAVFLAGLSMYFVRLNSGTFDNEVGKEWEAKLLTDGHASNFSGAYELVRHDDQYESYLLALGIPFFVVKIILVSTEVLEFKVPRNMEVDEWTLITKAGPQDQIDTFRLDEPFIVSMRKGKTILNTTASMSSNDTMVMESISQKTGNKLISAFTFSANGLVNTRTFVPKNITTKKLYKKMDQEDLKAQEEEESEDDLFLDWDD